MPDITKKPYKASRDPVDRITDEMILTPIGKLSPAQIGMIRRAINGDRSEEFLSRCTTIRQEKERQAMEDLIYDYNSEIRRAPRGRH